MSIKVSVFIGLFVAALALSTPENVRADNSKLDLSKLELEDLMDIEVTSVSRREERVIDAAAAVSVLTREDIRRSGASNIPDLLRLIPGMHVARSNGSTWAVSSRGFSDIFANKLLVMIDGRTVYNPIFSGTYWDAQDYVLDDIERIEVVRGPGGTLWGANAVNGVINIITKPASETQGGLVTGELGTYERGQVVARYGGKVDSTAYRAYAKYRDVENSKLDNGEDSYDDWYSFQGGFRADTKIDSGTDLTVQGDAYSAAEQLGGLASSTTKPYSRPFSTVADFSGGNILARLDRKFSNDSNLIVQGYVDRVNRASFRGGSHGITYDLDAQHRLATSSRNELVYGAGGRVIQDEFYTDGSFYAEPISRSYRKFSAFVQDQYELVQDQLKLIVGSKFEYNTFSHAEIQPNIRMLWKPQENAAIWAGISRAARTPSRYESDLGLDLAGFDPGVGIPGVARVIPNDKLASEILLAYEIGTRFAPSKHISFDIALFYFDYDNVVSFDDGDGFIDTSSGQAIYVRPTIIDNNYSAGSVGGEATVEWRPQSWLRFVGGYSFLNLDVSRDGAADDAVVFAREGQSPQHEFLLRTQIDLGQGWELDPTLRYVDSLSYNPVDSYVEMDLRLGYRPRSDLEFSIVGQNLLHDRHEEFESNPLGILRSNVSRAVVGKFTWHF